MDQRLRCAIGAVRLNLESSNPLASFDDEELRKRRLPRLFAPEDPIPTLATVATASNPIFLSKVQTTSGKNLLIVSALLPDTSGIQTIQAAEQLGTYINNAMTSSFASPPPPQPQLSLKTILGLTIPPVVAIARLASHLVRKEKQNQPELETLTGGMQKVTEITQRLTKSLPKFEAKFLFRGQADIAAAGASGGRTENLLLQESPIAPIGPANKGVETSCRRTHFSQHHSIAVHPARWMAFSLSKKSSRSFSQIFAFLLGIKRRWVLLHPP